MADRPTPEPRTGKLKIFFGYAPGVGRTRAMLDAAAERLGQGWRVLRMHDEGERSPEPEAAGPPGLVSLTCPAARGLDVDEIRRRAPDLVLVPDLARTNPAAARHRHRTQDVLELLEAGVDVWSTLEVRHVESLAELVERITGHAVQHTVPDSVLDTADDLELIDLPPEELIERMRRAAAAGAAPVTARTELPDRTMLVALREVAMRYAADRLHRVARQRSGGRHAPLGDRLLAAVGPSPTSARVIRAAGRMAQTMHVPWFAVHVAPAATGVDVASPVGAHLQLARSLGAEVAIVPASDIAGATAAFARAHGVTRILVGETRHSGWRSWLRPSLVHRVIAASKGIEVLVILGTEAPRPGDDVRAPLRPGAWRGHGGACVALLVATAIAWAFDAAGLGEADKVLVYLLAVTAAAAWLGRGPSVFASFGSVLLFNFFFTAPRFTFRVQDPDYLFTFAVMLVIGLLVSTLTSRIRDQSLVARERERRTEQLYRLSHDLSATTGHLQIVAAAEAHLRAFTNRDVSILLPDAGGELRSAGRASPWLSQGPGPMATADWVFAHGRPAGAGTDTHAGECALFLPLRAHDETHGVLAIRAVDPDLLLLLADNRRMVETFAAQVTMALQRDRLTEQVHRTLAQAENERLRSALLSSVSHDLRTPLATITGVTSSLLDAEQRIDPVERTSLLRSVHGEAERLARLLDNLFHMTRLESGEFAPQREWNVVEDLVGSALTRLARQLGTREVTTDIAEHMPLLRVDGVLIELVLTNLLDNATRYSPPDTAIEISTHISGQQVEIAVADRGPGLSSEEKRRAFEKFYRGPSQRRDGARGSGLGLAICAAIAQLHGGVIRIEDREGGGARFVLCLPIEDQPPALGEQPAVDIDAGEPA
ncbi:MAG TPA: DUF4118 domain-containing protein [Planctomycetota bacterium]|nr:DUF4118 domain-containing protein [Planctomycetota bacterium]